MQRKNQLLDYERIRFLHLLLKGYLQFNDIYEDYKRDNSLPRWREVETLCQDWFSELRDKAHTVFRRTPASEEEERLRDYELLCDLVIGVSYHESLQLQENLYLSKLYRPRYEELHRHLEGSDVEEYIQIGENLVREAEDQIPKNIQSIQQLMFEALTLVKKILSAQGSNRIVLRFLTQNLDLFERVYDKKSLDELFAGMFPGGLPEALWRSSQDLIGSGHYHCALDCFSRLALLKQSQKQGKCFDRSRVTKSLNKIHSEGKKLRDNELVSRSHNLLKQFKESAATA